MDNTLTGTYIFWNACIQNKNIKSITLKFIFKLNLRALLRKRRPLYIIVGAASKNKDNACLFHSLF